MDKPNRNSQNTTEIGQALKEKFNSKNNESFVQNPGQNNQIHEASLDPNKKW